MIKKILLILVVLMFMLDCSYAAEVTYYFDSYDSEYAGGAFDTDPENMVDGDGDTYAIAYLDNSTQYQLLDSFSGEIKTGTITKVEMRLKGYVENDTAQPGSKEYACGAYKEEGDWNIITFTTELTDTPAWTIWKEIDINPGFQWSGISTWADIANLNALVYCFTSGPEGQRSADVNIARVEMRVTFTQYDTGTVFQIAGD